MPLPRAERADPYHKKIGRSSKFENSYVTFLREFKMTSAIKAISKDQLPQAVGTQRFEGRAGINFKTMVTIENPS